MHYNTVNTRGVLILQDPRVDPTTNNNGAIILASVSGHTEIVKLLLQDPRVNPPNKEILSAQIQFTEDFRAGVAAMHYLYVDKKTINIYDDIIGTGITGLYSKFLKFLVKRRPTLINAKLTHHVC